LETLGGDVVGDEGEMRERCEGLVRKLRGLRAPEGYVGYFARLTGVS